MNQPHYESVLALLKHHLFAIISHQPSLLAIINHSNHYEVTTTIGNIHRAIAKRSRALSVESAPAGEAVTHVASPVAPHLHGCAKLRLRGSGGREEGSTSNY